MCALVRGADERLEVVERAVARMDVPVVGDVVAVVAQRRREERQQPQAGDAEPLQVVELLREALEVADAVVVAVEERLDVRLVDDRVLVPERIVVHLADVAVTGSEATTRFGFSVQLSRLNFPCCFHFAMRDLQFVIRGCVPAGRRGRIARNSSRSASA